MPSDFAIIVGRMLCFAAPAIGAPIGGNPQPLHRNAATSWTLIVGDPVEATQPGPSSQASILPLLRRRTMLACLMTLSAVMLALGMACFKMGAGR
jgi:hypothetical protein